MLAGVFSSVVVLVIEVICVVTVDSVEGSDVTVPLVSDEVSAEPSVDDVVATGEEVGGVVLLDDSDVLTPSVASVSDVLSGVVVVTSLVELCVLSLVDDIEVERRPNRNRTKIILSLAPENTKSRV